MIDEKNNPAVNASLLSGKLERKLKKDLQQLSDAVLIYLHQLDNAVSTDKTIPFRAGSNIAKLSNWLDMENDKIRYFALGVDHRKDDKTKAVKKLMRSTTKG